LSRNVLCEELLCL